MTKTLYVMVGLPGSGKSTYIDDIVTLSQSDEGGIYRILSTDDHIEYKANELGITYNEAFKDHINDAEKNLQRHLAKAIIDGDHIIWDQTNLRVKKRKTILNSVPKDYERIAIEFVGPFETVVKRVKDRAAITGKDIGYNILMSMNESREPVTLEEGFDDIRIVQFK